MVQRHYEHSAESLGHRISVTARTIINKGTIISAAEERALGRMEDLYEKPIKHPRAVLITGTNQLMRGVNISRSVKRAAEVVGKRVVDLKGVWSRGFLPGSVEDEVGDDC